MRDLFQRVRDAMGKEYDIRRVIGTGGMATVFEARNLDSGQSLAIKVLKPQLAVGTPRERFRREVAMASSLDHPNIVPILASGEKNGIAYCIMPFVNGETLRQRLVRDRFLPLPDAIQIASEIASALEEAHAHGIMHRDVKPENILLSNGHAMVTDFGIARTIMDDGSSLTISGSAIGTPNYMSPEQATGQPTDARTDIYSLGCVLHEMIVGTRPFAGLPSPFARDPKQSAKPASSLAKQMVPEEVDQVIVKALEWNPDNRFSSATEMSAALKTLQLIAGLPEPTVKGPGPVRGWAALGAAAAAILAAGFLVSRIVGPASMDPTVVGVDPFVLEGPSQHRSLAADFFESTTRSLDRRVGIELIRGQSPETPRFVVKMAVQVDTTVAPPAATITVELTQPADPDPPWRMTPVSAPMTRRGLQTAGAHIARDLAAAIRERVGKP